MLDLFLTYHRLPQPNRGFLSAGVERGETPMEFSDKVLKCIDCGQDFVFTAGERLFFRDKQFKNEPKRCKACKGKRLQALGVVPSTTSPKVETRAVCAKCGKETIVPFKPTQGRPVLCRECFQQKKTSAGSA